MKRLLLSVLAWVLTVSVVKANLNVVVTTPDLASIVQAIGGGRIELTTLARSTEDPHSVVARPELAARLNHADVLLEGGAGLEAGWLPALLNQAHNPKIMPGAPGHVSCGTGVPLLGAPASLDHSRAGMHSAGNPHYVLSPSNAKIAGKNIADGLAASDPGNAGVYRANLKKFDDAIDAKLVEWHEKLDPHRGQSIAAEHDSWPYFAKEFGLRMDLFLEPEPGVEPSPAHLDRVVEKMNEERARVLLVEPYLDRRAAESVARRNNAWIVDAPRFSTGLKGESGYIEAEGRFIDSLAAALSGEN